MASFLFQAKTPEGRLVKGEVVALDEEEARNKIRAQRLIPGELRPKGQSPVAAVNTKKNKGSVSQKELQIFTRQFAVLIDAGVPIVQGLEAMIGPGRSPALNSTLEDVLAEVSKGRRLAECLKEHPKVFDNMYSNLVAAGEESGALDNILNRLATYIEKSVRLKGKIVGALFYPAGVVVVSIIVVSVIMIFVIPSFVKMFEGNGVPLPWLTLQVMHASDFFVKRWYVILGFCVAVPYAFTTYYATEDGRRTIDPLLLKVPLFGELIKKGSIARFSRTMATMLAAGVRIMEAIDIAASTAKNYTIEQILMNAKEAISRGRTFSEQLKASAIMPDMVSQMISVGEQTGSLDSMLDKVANFYEDEVETTAAGLTSLIEPILLVVLGSIVAVLVIAMYLPIFGMAGAVSGG